MIFEKYYISFIGRADGDDVIAGSIEIKREMISQSDKGFVVDLSHSKIYIDETCTIHSIAATDPTGYAVAIPTKNLIEFTSTTPGGYVTGKRTTQPFVCRGNELTFADKECFITFDGEGDLITFFKKNMEANQ